MPVKVEPKERPIIRMLLPLHRFPTRATSLPVIARLEWPRRKALRREAIAHMGNSSKKRAFRRALTL
jgi:hypothetical protein